LPRAQKIPEMWPSSGPNFVPREGVPLC